MAPRQNRQVWAVALPDRDRWSAVSGGEICNRISPMADHKEKCPIGREPDPDGRQSPWRVAIVVFSSCNVSLCNAVFLRIRSASRSGVRAGWF